MKTFEWYLPLRSRFWAALGFLKRHFSLKEFYQLLLPSSFSKDKNKLADKYDRFLSEELKKECQSFPNNYLNLFSNKFEGQSYYEVVEMIKSVIINDEYHANNFVKKNSIIIDAGAHIGTFSVFVANLAKEGKVYSFEPVAKTFHFLKNNTKNYPQITCLNFGLGDEVSKKNILATLIHSNGSIFEDSSIYGEKPEITEDRKLESANIVTIDNFVNTNNVSRVDFIKIDVEGYEAKVLKGAKETIKKFKPVISMSAYHNPKDTEELPKILKEICSSYVCNLYTSGSEKDFVCQAFDSM